MTTVKEVVADMPQAKVFSVLDATSGYWKVKIDEASSKLCTFNAPFGRCRFSRIPFEIKSAPQVFQNHMPEQPVDMEGVKVIIDDLLLWGKDHDCDVAWGDCSKIRADKLQKLQNRAARIITWADYSIRSSDVLNSLQWSNLEERGKRHLLIMMF